TTEARSAGWEPIGHAYEQMPIHKVEDQRAMIHKAMDTLEKFWGKRPVGWLGPGLTQTLETPDLLAEAGVKYIGDWGYDEEPTVTKPTTQPLVPLPYAVELNAIPVRRVQPQGAELFSRRCADAFDRLYAEGKDRPRIMAIAIHPYISGQPFRI